MKMQGVSEKYNTAKPIMKEGKKGAAVIIV